MLFKHVAVELLTEIHLFTAAKIHHLKFVNYISILNLFLHTVLYG